MLALTLKKQRNSVLLCENQAERSMAYSKAWHLKAWNKEQLFSLRFLFGKTSSIRSSDSEFIKWAGDTEARRSTPLLGERYWLADHFESSVRRRSLASSTGCWPVTGAIDVGCLSILSAPSSWTVLESFFTAAWLGRADVCSHCTAFSTGCGTSGSTSGRHVDGGGGGKPSADCGGVIVSETPRTGNAKPAIEHTVTLLITVSAGSKLSG